MTLAAPDRHAEAEARLRAEIAGCTRLLNMEGLMGYSGHVSARLPGNRLLIQDFDQSRAALAPGRSPRLRPERPPRRGRDQSQAGRRGAYPFGDLQGAARRQRGRAFPSRPDDDLHARRGLVARSGQEPRGALAQRHPGACRSEPRRYAGAWARPRRDPRAASRPAHPGARAGRRRRGRALPVRRLHPSRRERRLRSTRRRPSAASCR